MLEVLDFGEPHGSELQEVLDTARPRDSLTLFHLISTVAPDSRSLVVDRLWQLDPALGRSSVVRARVLALDHDALDNLRLELEPDWIWAL